MVSPVKSGSIQYYHQHTLKLLKTIPPSFVIPYRFQIAQIIDKVLFSVDEFKDVFLAFSIFFAELFDDGFWDGGGPQTILLSSKPTISIPPHLCPLILPLPFQRVMICYWIDGVDSGDSHFLLAVPKEVGD